MVSTDDRRWEEQQFLSPMMKQIIISRGWASSNASATPMHACMARVHSSFACSRNRRRRKWIRRSINTGLRSSSTHRCIWVWFDSQIEEATEGKWISWGKPQAKLRWEHRHARPLCVKVKDYRHSQTAVGSTLPLLVCSRRRMRRWTKHLFYSFCSRLSICEFSLHFALRNRVSADWGIKWGTWHKGLPVRWITLWAWEAATPLLNKHLDF